ncbi:MAG: class II fructose-bisphosphate aldolase [Candidatus Omnitrophica bacterium]|nr:class II fructose-bisphosphate aldolase [Candidatus Omnitrophota bacterium]
MESKVNIAWRKATAIPGFNIPYRPMMAPVVQALVDTRTFGLIMVARLEWEKFQAGSLEEIAKEYSRVGQEGFTQLHLDHVPVIDEDGQKVDFLSIIKRALDCGYDSVMVDGSRLPLKENIWCTKKVVEMAHSIGKPVEAELGAVFGHEPRPLPSYEELFSSGQGFTDPEQAGIFVKETGVDWLSVAIGNIHGAISQASSQQPKLQARLDIEHLKKLQQAAGIPLVLHGGTGIKKEYIQSAIKNGTAKINIATAIRQVYQRWLDTSVSKAQQEVYHTACRILKDELALAGNLDLLREEV